MNFVSFFPVFPFLFYRLMFWARKLKKKSTRSPYIRWNEFQAKPTITWECDGKEERGKCTFSRWTLNSKRPLAWGFQFPNLSQITEISIEASQKSSHWNSHKDQFEEGWQQNYTKTLYFYSKERQRKGKREWEREEGRNRSGWEREG